MSAPGKDPFDEALRSGAPIDAQFEPAAAEAAKPRGPGWAGAAAIGVSAALVGAAGGIWGGDLIRPSGGPATVALKARVDALAADSKAFEARVEGPLAAAAELGSLLAELDAVSQRLDAALTNAPTDENLAALTAGVETLRRRIDAIEARAAAPYPDRPVAPAPVMEPAASGRLADAALALSAIEAAARRGVSFEADYRALGRAAPENEAVRRLAPFATGVAPFSALQAEFGAVRAGILVAAKQNAPAGRLRWLDRMFGDAVDVRRKGEDMKAIEATLDEAEAALADRDLPRALAALGRLPPATLVPAADWTGRAQQRVTLEATLEDVRFSLIDGDAAP